MTRTRTARTRTARTRTARTRAPLAAVVAALAGSALWLTGAGAALAHGGALEVDVTAQPSGHVTADVTWAGDGDPVDERVGATVNAVSGDGRTALGPWRLVRATGTPTGYTTVEALPPGRWQVTVEVGHPGLGRAQREVTVPAGTPASPAAPAAPAAASGDRVVPATPAASVAAASPQRGTAASRATASDTAGSGGSGATGGFGGVAGAAAGAAAVAGAVAVGAVVVRRRGAATGGTGR
ncbi:hypothetical protein [Streptomyces sp. DH12]|uniref:hypothetical protein n=1 Tax=Streptomyces sp. DH12 TaxID=2857010 RepID=UPI001E418D15|nr:hypothetical protein [Streptomyces sp. DH12]